MLTPGPTYWYDVSLGCIQSRSQIKEAGCIVGARAGPGKTCPANSAHSLSTKGIAGPNTGQYNCQRMGLIIPSAAVFDRLEYNGFS